MLDRCAEASREQSSDYHLKGTGFHIKLNTELYQKRSYSSRRKGERVPVNCFTNYILHEVLLIFICTLLSLFLKCLSESHESRLTLIKFTFQFRYDHDHFSSENTSPSLSPFPLIPCPTLPFDHNHH